MNSKTKKIVGIGLFTAIVLVLQFLGGGIKFGVFSISLVLLPIVVGAAVYGWQAGAWLGFTFGVAVLLSGDAAAFMVVDPLGTVLTVLAKGSAAGLCSGLAYKFILRILDRQSKKHLTFVRYFAVLVAALVCPIVNTGVFLLGCKLFFMETIADWGTALGFTNVASYMFLGLAGTNFLIELGTNLLLSPVIVRIITYTK